MAFESLGLVYTPPTHDPKKGGGKLPSIGVDFVSKCKIVPEKIKKALKNEAEIIKKT